MDREGMRRIAAEVEGNILRYFLLKPLEPDLGTVGPKSQATTLSNVLWYCQEIRQSIAETRATVWNQERERVEHWFWFMCGLAAAEGMLPSRQEFLRHVQPSKEPLAAPA